MTRNAVMQYIYCLSSTHAQSTVARLVILNFTLQKIAAVFDLSRMPWVLPCRVRLGTYKLRTN